MTIKIGINGLGRIGRCVLRAIFEEPQYQDIEIVSVNAPSPISNYLNLINFDSVHGKFKFRAESEGDNLIIDGKVIKKNSSKEIENINWDEAEYVLECTGKFNDKISASKHLKNGVKQILVSAPCKDADNTIVYGVNHETLDNSSKVISIGSCTTNCLAPIAKIYNDSLGIEKGFVTTIHAYTNDQNILDNSHKDLRRARAAALSMIPTSTGAAKAIGLVIPELVGKLDGSAIRVPTPNVSLIDFSFVTKNKTNVIEVNEIFRKATNNDKYSILAYLQDQLVSVDMNHSPYSCVFDPFETKVIKDNLVRVVAWYDNEWAYSLRMLDMIKFIAKNR